MARYRVREYYADGFDPSDFEVPEDIETDEEAIEWFRVEGPRSVLQRITGEGEGDAVDLAHQAVEVLDLAEGR